jgi:predicted O-methyltransferase YrrM
MKTRPEDLAVINSHIFPSIIGAKRFKALSGTSVHMAYNEAAVFQALLSNLKPKYAVEIGTETGATLAVIARHAEHAVSIDIDPKVKAELSPAFANVKFITGSSHDVLPVLLQKLAAENTNPDFLFVDGDHSAEGVRKDLEFILSVCPTRPMTVLMHDSFNPHCRQGILSARWSQNPFCHFVDVDFSPGVLHPDESIKGQMWGGLGYALFLPEPRKHVLDVKTTHRPLFEAAFRSSIYAQPAKPRPAMAGR